jgi:Uma2 family endonuclease
MSNESATPVQSLPPEHSSWGILSDDLLTPEDLPNVESLVIEDGKPVDNIFVEKQYRLLTEPLYSSWRPNDSFLALANVGLFYQSGQPGLAPDVMISLGVPTSRDLGQKENRSYLLWIMGKPPDAIVEVVSDRRGGEETEKMTAYARMGVPYYLIFDPLNRLHHGGLRAFGLHEGVYQPIDARWLPKVGLGAILWEGEFEGQQARWLRWCDQGGLVIPTGEERAEQEKQRAEQEKQRAEQEKQRAEQEKQRAEQEKQRAERYAEQLRALGVEPKE